MQKNVKLELFMTTTIFIIMVALKRAVTHYIRIKPMISEIRLRGFFYTNEWIPTLLLLWKIWSRVNDWKYIRMSQMVDNSPL
jgi:hypothetical protein